MGLWGPLCLVAAILPHGLTAGAAVVVVDGGGGDGGDGVGHRGGREVHGRRGAGVGPTQAKTQYTSLE